MIPVGVLLMRIPSAIAIGKAVVVEAWQGWRAVRAAKAARDYSKDTDTYDHVIVDAGVRAEKRRRKAQE